MKKPAPSSDLSRVKILRSDPEKGFPPFFQEFLIPFESENTILDSLYYIYSHLDGSLAFRGSCFAGGWCGVCTVKVNGKVLLPCRHFMDREMVIEPLPGYPVVRDLIVDFSSRQKSNTASKNQLQEG